MLELHFYSSHYFQMTEEHLREQKKKIKILIYAIVFAIFSLAVKNFNIIIDNVAFD